MDKYARKIENVGGKKRRWKSNVYTRGRFVLFLHLERLVFQQHKTIFSRSEFFFCFVVDRDRYILLTLLATSFCQALKSTNGNYNAHLYTHLTLYRMQYTMENETRIGRMDERE